MNILLDKLPTEYEGLKINTNFRSFILFELLMQDNDVEDKEKILLAIKLMYKEQPINLKKAIDGILWFYSGGKEKKEEKKSAKKETKKRNEIYSYKYDAELIYSAFLDQYGIDLNEIEYLHWFKFKALFEGLKDENKICQIMGYRALDISKIKDKKEREKYRKIKRQYALPDERTQEQKEQDFAEAFW